MDQKKWPVLAQVLIALGCIGSLMTIVRGFALSDIFLIIFGLAGLIIYWSVYKLKGWSLIGLNIFLSLNIVFNLIAFFIQKGVNPTFIISMCVPVLFLFYFNSASIRQLFK
ncbi:MAG: hypothetical protein NT033_08175 [Candidatus Omnitrophica bacterium]|nr:hypothetical protein [Candidatus Omnitrophota bacterium]